MIDLFYYILSSIGLMCILKYGTILGWLRALLAPRFRFFHDLFKCSLCLGFWTGGFISTFIYFFTDSFENKYYLFPLVSAVLCWVADSLIGIAKYTERYLEKK